MAWPVEIQVTVIGGVFAVVGYMFKSGQDWWQARQRERARTIAHLQRLQSLLNASGAVFDMQQEQVKRLTDHRKGSGEGIGYEKTMARHYSDFDDQEKEIHSIVRAYTQHSMRPVNLAISEWLKSDELFKTGVVDSLRRKELAASLFALEMHLLLWHAKYETWIPDHPQHALVYMTDEDKHGLGFPGKRGCGASEETGEPVDGSIVQEHDVDNDVALVLEELRSR